MRIIAQEKNFENKVKAYLSSKGIYAFGTVKNKMLVEPIGYYEKRFANRMTKKGLPDLHIMVLGKSFDIEVKAEDGSPSAIQLKMISQINKSCGCSFVLYPSGFEHFKAFIEEIINSTPIGKYDLPTIWKGEQWKN